MASVFIEREDLSAYGIDVDAVEKTLNQRVSWAEIYTTWADDSTPAEIRRGRIRGYERVRDGIHIYLDTEKTVDPEKVKQYTWKCPLCPAFVGATNQAMWLTSVGIHMVRHTNESEKGETT